MASDTPQPLPHNLDAERAVLGALLLNETLLPQVADTLTTADFFRDAHRRVYGCILALVEDGVAIDFVTVKEALARREEIDAVGGPAYLAGLTDGVPRSTNITHYAAIVREKARLRDTIRVATKLTGSAYAQEEPAATLAGTASEALQALAAASGKATGPVHIRPLLTEGIEAVEQSHRIGGAITGLATGLREVDQMTAGLHPTDLVIVAARTSVGKTAYALNIARRVATLEPTLIFSLEMSRTQLVLRLLAAEARVDSHRLRSGYLGEQHWAALSKGLTALGDLHLYIDDTGSLAVWQARARAKVLKATLGRLGLVIVDYIQLMRGAGKFENRTQEVGSISRGLKAMAKELDVPVVALSQLSRKTEARKDARPILSDLRESGDLEQDADTVLLLWRPEDTDGDAAEVIVAKQRNGPTGVCHVRFIREYTRFENKES